MILLLLEEFINCINWCIWIQIASQSICSVTAELCCHSVYDSIGIDKHGWLARGTMCFLYFGPIKGTYFHFLLKKNITTAHSDLGIQQENINRKIQLRELWLIVLRMQCLHYYILILTFDSKTLTENLIKGALVSSFMNAYLAPTSRYQYMSGVHKCTFLSYPFPLN